MHADEARAVALRQNEKAAVNEIAFALLGWVGICAEVVFLEFFDKLKEPRGVRKFKRIFSSLLKHARVGDRERRSSGRLC